ncbi:MAG TPA: hypothetical protein VH394_28315 [Thermoanaerobaculia bacterium]|nr:hypothetical protein [Thermoanaerobaculia bacterium]
MNVAFPGVSRDWLAQVDTGAAYSILEQDVARALGLMHGIGPLSRLSTRLGDLRGRLLRVPLKILADEGDSLEFEATFFVSSDWHGGTFLGYSGLLDRLRIGLDCPRNLFYFGD